LRKRVSGVEHLIVGVHKFDRFHTFCANPMVHCLATGTIPMVRGMCQIISMEV